METTFRNPKFGKRTSTVVVMEEEQKENLIDKLHEADMLYFVLGSLISADSLIDVEACHKALDCLENLKRDFETSKLKEDQKLKSFLENAESIIKRDMRHFEETATNQLKDKPL